MDKNSVYLAKKQYSPPHEQLFTAKGSKKLEKYIGITVFSLFILFLYSQVGRASTSYDLICSLSMENSSFTDQVGGYTFVNSSIPKLNTTGGINNNYPWERGIGCLQNADGSVFEALNGKNHSMNIWVWPGDGLDNEQFVLSWYRDASNRAEIDILANGSAQLAAYISGGWQTVHSTKRLQRYSWNMLTLTWNQSSTDLCWYVNGSNKVCGLDDETRLNILGSNVGHVNIKSNYNSDGGSQCHDSNEGVDGLDEFELSNRTWTATEVSDLWNSGSGDFYPHAGGGAEATLNMSVISPSNNSQFNIETVSINATVNLSDSGNFSLWVGNGTAGAMTLNQTTTKAAGTNVLVEFNLTFASDVTEAMRRVYINGTTNLTDINTSTSYIYVDRVNPIITWTTPATTNNTVYYNNTEFNSSITIEDANLYSFELNITNSTGGKVVNYSNTSLTGLTSYTINRLINTTTNKTGLFNCSLEVCDGHTAKNKTVKGEIKDNKLVFDDGAVNVSFEDLGETEDLALIDIPDRFEFNMTANNEKKTRYFIVESQGYIDILDGQTEWEGHLIIDGKYWVDFEEEVSADVDDIQVTRISDNKVRVTVLTNVLKKKYKFKSIGNLNCIIQERQFKINTAPTFQQTPTNKNIYHDVNLTYDLNCTDAEGDTVTYYDNSSLFTINSTDGRINHNPIVEQYGTYNVSINCSDGTNSTIKTFLYVINDSAPNLTISSSINATISTLNTNLTFTGQDNESDSLTYFLYTGLEPTSLTLKGNTTNTYYSWTGLVPDVTYYWKISAYDGARYSSNSSLSWIHPTFTSSGSGGSQPAEESTEGILNDYTAEEQDTINNVINGLTDPTFQDMLDAYQEILDEGIDMTPDQFESLFNNVNYGDPLPTENVASAGGASPGGNEEDFLPEGTITIDPKTITFTERIRAKKITIKNSDTGNSVIISKINLVENDFSQYLTVRAKDKIIPPLGEVEVYAVLEGYKINKSGQVEIVMSFDKHQNELIKAEIDWGGVVLWKEQMLSIYSTQGWVKGTQFIIQPVLDVFTEPIGKTNIAFGWVALGLTILGSGVTIALSGGAFAVTIISLILIVLGKIFTGLL